MNLIPKTEEELKTIFTASCVESAANAVGCSSKVMYPYAMRRADRKIYLEIL